MKRIAGLFLGLSAAALALPEGPSIQAGNVQSQTSGAVMTVQQMSDRAIINWNRFNIDPQELVRVIQPHSAAILLNRVVGQDPSHILGQLQANGNIWLLNPNGILFGPQSQVNVGGLLASTLQLRDQDFLSGRYSFTAPEGPQAALINQGELRVSEQGYLVLAAPLISQEGLLVANLGRVAMIAGQHATLSLDGLIHYRLTPESGTPGPILLDSSMLSQVLRNVVAQGTLPEASLVQRQDGRIWLTQASGSNLQSGQVTAQSVVLDSTRGTLMNSGSSLSGSDLRVLSQGTAITRAGSSLLAPNGFAEVSAARVSLAGQVQAQDFLIDPEFLHIVPGNSGTLDGQDPVFAGTSAGSNSTISVGYLQSITQGSVYLEANNSLFVDDGASLSMSPGVGLTLATVFGNVTFENLNDVVETTGANLNISAGNNIQVGQLRSNGRDVSLTSSQGNITAQVVADRLFVDTPGEVALQTQINDLFLFQGGNVSLSNSGDIAVRSLDVAGNLTLNTSGNLFFDVAEASNQVTGTAVINATESVILPDVFFPLIAETIFVDAGQDIVAPIFAQFPGPHLDSANVALRAGGRLNTDVEFTATNISLQSAQGNLNYFFDSDRTVVSAFGLEGISAPNVTLNSIGNLSLAGTISGSQVSLDAAAITAPLNSNVPAVRATSVNLSASGDIGSLSTPLRLEVEQLEASSVAGSLNLKNDSPQLTTTGLSAATGLSLISSGNVNLGGSTSSSGLMLLSAGQDLVGSSSILADDLQASGNQIILNSQVSGALNISSGGLTQLTNTGNPTANFQTSQLQLNNSGDLRLDGTSSVGDASLNVTGALSGSSNSLLRGNQVSLTANNISLPVEVPDLTATSSTVLEVFVPGNLGVRSLQASEVQLRQPGNVTAVGNGTHITATLIGSQASLGSATAPLRISGSPTLQISSPGQIFLESDSTVTGGGIQADSFSLRVNSGDFVNLMPLTANAIEVRAEAGGLLGRGLYQGQQGRLFAQTQMMVAADVPALELVTPGNVNLTSLNGVRPMGQGFSASQLNVTILNGNLDLSDPSLGLNPAIRVSTQADLSALNGSILGTNPSLRPDIVAPVVNFSASNTVGTPDTPVRVNLESSFNTTTPGFVERFGFVPPLPPPPDLPPPTVPPAVTVVVDATSLGLPVGNDQAQLVVESLGNPRDPQGLWSVSWRPSSSGTLQRGFLLDMSLEQLLDQPTTSGYLLMTLEQLLQQPLLSPFLEKSLEELLNTDLQSE